MAKTLSAVHCNDTLQILQSCVLNKTRNKEVTYYLVGSTESDPIKGKISDERRKQLETLNVVSEDENAHWLIDYWCGKDVRGLIQMPFSRHWIMHIEACIKIRDKQLSKR